MKCSHTFRRCRLPPETRSALTTAADATSPFYSLSSNSTSSASNFNSFVQVLDYTDVIYMRNATSLPGSNSPFLRMALAARVCTASVVSAELAIDQWTTAGAFSLSKE